ncbi:universal stress protein [Rhodobacteraceae bacterium W635]|uniref:universal stress protein n=1 Tax=Nioella halotolerans TaxID=2303578 RepID=UPI000E3B66F3|nr:universal stress protein [Rhodobacteraceae bacterium W635]
MFKRIMIPVDLAHEGNLERALQVACDLSSHYGAELVYVGVTGETPSSVAHTPAEFAAKLETFAKEETKARGGGSARAHTITAHDPAVEIDKLLEKAATDLGADLVVMGSHIPSRFDFSSHGGHVANHATCSVMLVRDQ